MQPARFKLHAGERTCSPVQRPNFRGQDRRLVRPMPIPTVSHHQGRAPGLVTKVAVVPPTGEGHQPREELEKTKEAQVVKVHQA